MEQREHSRLGFHAHRRPSGAPPPLPKSIGFTGWLWLLVTFVVVGLASLWLHFSLSALHLVDGFITDVVVDVRMGWLDGTTRFFNTAASTGGIAVLAAGVILATGWFRRWRHIIICLVSIAAVELAAGGFYLVASRPRPFGVVPIAGWEGFSSPSMPIAGLAAVGISAIYMLVVPGRPRYYAKWVLTATLVVVEPRARSTSASTTPPTTCSARWSASRSSSPPSVRSRPTTSSRQLREARQVGPPGRHRQARRGHQGRDEGAARPHDHEHQAGRARGLRRFDAAADARRSTRAARHVALFAKLYAKNHVRADRWYKLGRTMLYGRLEDETPFSTVRRFVEYEDYTLRLLGDYGFSTPDALGIVEITPEREYLIAMEFFEDARRDRRRRGRRHRSSTKGCS